MLLGPAAAPGEARQDALPANPAAVLAEALHRRYDCALLAVVTMEVRGRTGDVLRRTLRLASKPVDGRLMSLGRFDAPEYVRGTALLSLERAHAEASDDHFLYLPSMRRVRRIQSAQRADAFLGTDLSYEDFERRRAEDYDLEARPAERVEGEEVHVVLARPHYDSGYERVEFAVATADHAILRMHYFKRGAERPFKLFEAPRPGMRAEREFRIPSRIRVENLERGTRTEVVLERLRIDPPLEDGLFSLAALESGRPLPGFDDADGETRAPRRP